MTPKFKDRPRREAPRSRTREAKPGKPTTPSQDSRVEGYWQEWTPQDPVPNTAYCTQLYLPPGAYIVNAAAGIHLAAEAPGPSDVECSLFVAHENRSLNQVTLLPGDGRSIAATAHVDCTETTEVQWNCGGTTAPFRLQLAVTAVEVHRLHHVGTQPTRW